MSDLKCKQEGDIYPAIIPVLILLNYPSRRREKSAGGVVSWHFRDDEGFDMLDSTKY